MSRLGLINKLKTRFGETPADSDTAATNIGGDIYDETTDVTKLSDADGDTYIEVEESADDDHIRIGTAGVERVTVNSSGNVGIGENSPGFNLDIKSATPMVRACLDSTSTSGVNIIGWRIDNKGVFEGGLFYHEASDEIHIYSSNGVVPAIRIDQSQRVGIGNMNPSHKLDVNDDAALDYVVHFINDGNNANRYGMVITCGADNGVGQTFYLLGQDGDGNNIGYIEQTAGSVFQLVDVSDERLKNNIKPTKIKGTDIIMKIPIKEFYKKESKEKITAGFVAQDIRKIYPQATSAYNKDGEEYYGVSESKLIAPLMKMCQEQQEIIDKQQKVIHNFEKRLKKLEEKDEK